MLYLWLPHGGGATAFYGTTDPTHTHFVAFPLPGLRMYPINESGRVKFHREAVQQAADQESTPNRSRL